MLTSYILSPRTFIYSRKTVIDSTFIDPLYRGRLSIYLQSILYSYSLYLYYLLLVSLLLNIYLSYNIYSRSLLVLVASYPLLLQQYFISVTLGLYLVLQQLPYFLFSFYYLQIKGFLAYILKYITSLKGLYPLYIFQSLVYILLYQVALGLDPKSRRRIALLALLLLYIVVIYI